VGFNKHPPASGRVNSTLDFARKWGRYSMNDELAALYAADRREHNPQTAPPGTYEELRERDRQRRRRASEMVAADELQTAEDYFHAAQLFHHGDNINDFELAYKLAVKAAEMGHRPARWMAAAACDRWLIEQGKPQKYGTQYAGDEERLWLIDVDPETTDEERIAWDVPPLSEALRRAEEVTRNMTARSREGRQNVPK
jgi:hypothetical protein